MLYAVLAVFIQTLVPHKFVGLLVMLLFLVAQIDARRVGFEHNLYQYAGTSTVPLSDMNGQGDFARHAAWFRAYWTAVRRDSRRARVRAVAARRVGAAARSALQAPAGAARGRAGVARRRRGAS